MVRPGLTIVVTVADLVCAVLRIPLPWKLWGLNAIMVVFWFGTRAWRDFNSFKA